MIAMRFGCNGWIRVLCRHLLSTIAIVSFLLGTAESASGSDTTPVANNTTKQIEVVDWAFKENHGQVIGSDGTVREDILFELNSGPFKELNLYFIFNKSEDTNQKTSLSIEIRASIRTLLKPLVYLLAKPKLKKKIPEVIASIKQLSEKIALARLEGEKTAFSA